MRVREVDDHVGATRLSDVGLVNVELGSGQAEVPRLGTGSYTGLHGFVTDGHNAADRGPATNRGL
jgi:hypothetical protein